MRGVFRAFTLLAAISIALPIIAFSEEKNTLRVKFEETTAAPENAEINGDLVLDDCIIPPDISLDKETIDLIQGINTALKEDRFLKRGYLTPLELRLLDGKTLGELIVKRLDRECEQVRTPASAEKNPIASQLIMLVPSKVVDSVIKYGFKNQHVTETTGGCNCPEKRIEQEQKLAGLRLPYSGKMREILPKYSLFNVLRSDFGTYNLPVMYGDTLFVFKEKVKQRATWTPTDSLGTPLAKTPRTTKYRKANNTFKCDFPYCEAQIWGPLDIDDVDQIMVLKGKALPASLMQLGIPIYEFEHSNTLNLNQTAAFKKGKLVWKGSATKQLREPLRKLNAEELEAAIPEESNPVIRRILNNELLQALPTEELIRRYSNYLGDQKKLFAELVIRNKTPELFDLIKNGTKSTDPFFRMQAIIGLSELPKAELKPYLLASLNDTNLEVQITAIAIALEFHEDEEIALALQKVRSIKEYYNPAPEWLKRLRQKNFCDS